AGRDASPRRFLDGQNFTSDDDLLTKAQRPMLGDALHHVDATVGRDAVADAFLDRQRNERGGVDVAAEHGDVDTPVTDQPRLLGAIDDEHALLVSDPFDRLDFRIFRCRTHLNPLLFFALLWLPYAMTLVAC